jgi:hypothetical protein
MPAYLTEKVVDEKTDVMAAELPVLDEVLELDNEARAT